MCTEASLGAERNAIASSAVFGGLSSCFCNNVLPTVWTLLRDDADLPIPSRGNRGSTLWAVQVGRRGDEVAEKRVQLWQQCQRCSNQRDQEQCRYSVSESIPSDGAGELRNLRPEKVQEDEVDNGGGYADKRSNRAC